MQVAVLFDADPVEEALLAAAPGVELGPLEEAEAAVVHSFADLPADAWARARRLRWILSLPAGADHVPFARLPPDVRVASMHGPNATAIAEHAMALLLAAAKRIPRDMDAMRAGGFDQTRLSKPVAGATLLVVGAGPLGREAARLGAALGMRVEVARRSGGAAAALPQGADGPVGPSSAPLDEALPRADFALLALPLTRETRGLVGAAWLARMKRDAVLVNVARGKLVDREALAAHLRAHPGFVYATDVWWRYPREGERFDEPLLALPNVVGSPHAAALVPGWRREMAGAAARALADLAAGRPERLRWEDPADYDWRAAPQA